MDKKSTKLLHNPAPLKIRTEEDIEKERRDFFRNCERISRAPASIFLEGNRFSHKAKLFALPFYAYAGIEKGHYERFMYEEFEWRKPSSEKIPYFIENGKIRKRLPHEEKVMFKSETPISSIRDDRMLNYQIYFNEELKKYLIRREEIEKLIQKGESFDSIINRKKVDFKELEPKFKGYFKIKVWSEIPPYIGLNEGAAIATAVAFLVELESFPTNVNRPELIQKFLDLKINRPEEIIVDWLFMGMFSRALQFDFFSNGAAVFASIMGNSRKQDTINYECLFYSEMKRFFEPRPEISHKDIKLHMQAFEKIRKVKGINAYFDECSNLSKKTLDTTPLFNWNYSKIEFKNKQELALSVMERGYISGDDRDFKVPLDAEAELHLLSPAAFVVIGDPSFMVLCERKPEKYIFGKEKDEVYSKYSPLYSSRTDGWEVQGASVIGLKKPKEAELKRPEGEKAEYARMWTNQTKLEGDIINKEEFDKYDKNKLTYQIFIIDRGELERNSIGEVNFGKKIIVKEVRDKKKNKKVKIKTDITATEYRILFHTLTRGGRAGDIFEILKQCFPEEKSPDPHKRWFDYYKKEPKIFWQSTRTYRKTIGVLSTFLRDKIGVEFQTRKKKIYNLLPLPSYCILKII